MKQVCVPSTWHMCSDNELNKLHQPHKDSRVSEGTVVVNMSHSSRPTLSSQIYEEGMRYLGARAWTTAYIPAHAGSATHCSCCSQGLQMHPVGQLSGLNFFHTMWELFKRLHSSLTSLFSVRSGGSVHKGKKPHVRNIPHWVHCIS